MVLQYLLIGTVEARIDKAIGGAFAFASVEVRGIEPLSYKELIIPAFHKFRIKFNLINFPK